MPIKVSVDIKDFNYYNLRSLSGTSGLKYKGKNSNKDG